MSDTYRNSRAGGRRSRQSSSADRIMQSRMREAGEPDPEEEVPEDGAEDARDRIWQRSY